MPKAKIFLPRGLITALRARKGWSQAELVKNTRLSERTVTNVERGEGINTDTLSCLAAAFGMDPEDLSRMRPEEVARPIRAHPVAATALVTASGLNSLHPKVPLSGLRGLEGAILSAPFKYDKAFDIWVRSHWEIHVDLQAECAVKRWLVRIDLRPGVGSINFDKRIGQPTTSSPIDMEYAYQFSSSHPFDGRPLTKGQESAFLLTPVAEAQVAPDRPYWHEALFRVTGYFRHFLLESYETGRTRHHHDATHHYLPYGPLAPFEPAVVQDTTCEYYFLKRQLLGGSLSCDASEYALYDLPHEIVVVTAHRLTKADNSRFFQIAVDFPSGAPWREP